MVRKHKGEHAPLLAAMSLIMAKVGCTALAPCPISRRASRVVRRQNFARRL